MPGTPSRTGPYPPIDPQTTACSTSATGPWCTGKPAGTWPPGRPGAGRRPRIGRHTGLRRYFLATGALLRDAGRRAGIPGVMAHGRLDISRPIDIPWRLAQVWPGGVLVLIDDAAHTGSATMTEALVAATDRFAARG